MGSGYVELHAQSGFSFLEGAEQPETLIAEAARLEMPAVALVDRDGLYGAPRFYRTAVDAGVKPLVGSELTLADGTRLPLLVEDRDGYRNLSRLITRAKLSAPKGETALTREEGVPVVATNQPLYARPGGRALADVLACIREKTTLDAAGTLLTPNGERLLKSPAAMSTLFADIPEALAATGELAMRLSFTLKDLGYRFPDFPVPPGETPLSYLRTLVERGVRERYGKGQILARARQQVAHELEIIGRLDLAGYFLIVWDIVEYCRTHDILVQGRGSAANSAVCYALGITAVDPVGMDLLFERFLSESRGEWPDIDLDLPSGDRREAAIQYVYRRYGRHGAGMTANVITYRGRSAAREVGKALGLPGELQDRLARLGATWGFQESPHL